MPSGKFITFEGPNGAGKSTALRAVHSALTALHRPVHIMREPGGSALGEAIRGQIRDPAFDVDPLAQALLFVGLRIQNVRKEIEPRLAAGTIVLCDRFRPSTEVYQMPALANSDERTAVANLHEWFVRAPDLTVFIIPSAELLLQRKLSKAQDVDKFEPATLSGIETERQRYLDVYEKMGSASLLIETVEAAEQIITHPQIRSVLSLQQLTTAA